jgi:hypothetical protein
MADDLEGDDIWGDAPGGEGPGTHTLRRPEEEPEEALPVAAPVPDTLLEDEDTRHMSLGELRQRIHLINNDIRVMKSDVQRITHESRAQRDRIRENQEKVKLNKQLPYLVANVVEILEPDAEDGTCIIYCGCCVILCVTERERERERESMWNC